MSGIIVRGAGKAAYFTGLEWVRKQCAEKLNFLPYPGTLNIQLDDMCLPYLKELQKKPAITFLSDDPKFCNAGSVPASLSGIFVAIIIPEEKVNIHGRNIIEVMAPVNLKETLSLHDGDRVALLIEGNQGYDTPIGRDLPSISGGLPER